MYIVVELQKNGDSIGNVVNTYTDINAAESSFHSILAAAALSSVEVHSAVIMNELGQTLKSEYYYHPVQPEPEIEPEE